MVVVNGHEYIDLAYGTTTDQQTCDVAWHVRHAGPMLASGDPKSRAYGFEILDATLEHLDEE